MLLLNRYMIKNVIVATLLVSSIFLGVELFILLFGELADLGKANYTIGKVVSYVLMQLPFGLYQFFPMLGFLGCLMGLGRLANGSELLVMRVCGVSIGQITYSVIKAAMLMLIVVTVMGEVASPKIQVYADHMKAIALGDQTDFSSLGGVWLRNKNQFIHFGNVISLEQANEVNVFDVENYRLKSSSYAPVAKKISKNVWRMFGVQQTLFSSQKLLTRQLPSFDLNIKFNPQILALGQQSIDESSLAGLYKSIKYRARAGLDTEQYQFAFWQRLLQPLSTTVMIILGVPFIFGSLRSASMGLRVLAGVVIGMVLYILNSFIGPLAVVYQISPVIAASIPIVVFVLAGFVLFRRI